MINNPERSHPPKRRHPEYVYKHFNMPRDPVVFFFSGMIPGVGGEAAGKSQILLSAPVGAGACLVSAAVSARFLVRLVEVQARLENYNPAVSLICAHTKKSFKVMQGLLSMICCSHTPY